MLHGSIKRKGVTKYSNPAPNVFYDAELPVECVTLQEVVESKRVKQETNAREIAQREYMKNREREDRKRRHQEIIEQKRLAKTAQGKRRALAESKSRKAKAQRTLKKHQHQAQRNTETAKRLAVEKRKSMIVS